MSGREIGASLLAGAWVAIAILALETTVPSPPWRGPEVLGVSIAFLVYRTVAWGPLPAVLVSDRPLVVVAALALVVDVAVLGADALAPTLAGLAVAFLPAQLFNRWTRERVYLRARVALHFIYYTTLLVWVIPALGLELSGRAFDLTALTPLDKILLQVAALPGIFGIAATLEFRDRGRGTPMPYDPPLALVTSGPFAYVANPFQITKVALVLGLGVYLESGFVVLTSVAIFAYGATLARRREDRELPVRFGSAWVDYRSHVRRWVPRWRPYRNSRHPRAVFYFDGDCEPCRQLAGLLSRASSLDFVSGGAAQSRMTYDPRDGGTVEHGVAALARALEHVNLGWAFVGWSMRVPILSSLFQVIADVVAPGGERRGCQSTMTVSVGDRSTMTVSVGDRIS